MSDQTGKNRTHRNQKGGIDHRRLPLAACNGVGDDQRFVNTYWKSFGNRLHLQHLRLGHRDEDGYYFILGRT